MYVALWTIMDKQKLTHALSFWIFKKKFYNSFDKLILILIKKAYNFYTNLKIALFVSKLAGCAKYVRSSKAEECVTG